MSLSLNLYSSKFIVPYILKLFKSVKVTKFLISEYCEHCEKVYILCINILEHIHIKSVLNIEAGFESFAHTDRYHYYS